MTVRLAARSLEAGYPATPRVLRDVTLEVRQGRRLALLGANGSGKTTLLKSLSGALPVQSGQVITAGGVLSYDRAGLRAHRQRVQLVLQDPDDQLFAGDVASDVAFGPVNLGLGREEVERRVSQACALLGISELAQRPIHHLSYGQRKRVAIAGAVAMRPDVLLLDEPTAGLDPAGVTAMLRTLKTMEEAGTSVVLSTHDVALAWEWADEAAIVGGGGVCLGPVTEMLTDRELLSASALDLPWPVALLGSLGITPERWPRSTAEVARMLAGPAISR